MAIQLLSLQIEFGKILPQAINEVTRYIIRTDHQSQGWHTFFFFYKSHKNVGESLSFKHQQ